MKGMDIVDVNTAKFRSSCGRIILLDKEDFERVTQHVWRVEQYKNRKIGVYSQFKKGSRFVKISLSRFLLQATGRKLVQRNPKSDPLDYMNLPRFSGHAEIEL